MPQSPAIWYTITWQEPIFEGDEYTGENEHIERFRTQSRAEVTDFLRNQSAVSFEYYVTEWDRDPDEFWAEITDDVPGEEWLWQEEKV